MLHGPTLLRGERRQIGKLGGSGVAQQARGERAGLVPAGKQRGGGEGQSLGQGLGGGEAAEKTAPFGEQPIDVAATGLRHLVGKGVRQRAPRSGAFDHRLDDLARTVAVGGGKALFEVTLDGEAPISFLANGGEAAEAAGVGAGEAVAGEEIGAVEEQVFDRIAAVFETGGEGQALGSEKDGDDGAR